MIVLLTLNLLFTDFVINETFPDKTTTKYMVGNWYINLVFPLFAVNLGRVFYILMRPVVIRNKHKLIRYCRKKGWMCIKRRS